MPPIVYFPFIYADDKGMLLPRKTGTFLVRTFGSSRLTPASTLRHQMLQAAPQFRVSNIRTQEEVDALHTTRERLAAMLGLFFSAVALLLTGIGLFGVLDYSVFQRQREIGIRMALGAQPRDILGHVTSAVLWKVGVGAAGGICLGAVSVHYIESLLYQTRATDLSVLYVPLLLLTTVALGTAMPALVHALRIDLGALRDSMLGCSGPCLR
jgi:putative ABC transport system permease protein